MSFKGLLLYRMYGRREVSDEDHASIIHMECLPHLDKEDETLGSVYLQWSTEDEVEYTIEASMGNKKWKWPKVGNGLE